MRAAVLYRPGDVRVEEVTKPQIKPDHALVRIAACGVCGSDIPRVLIKGAHKLPIICGHEFAGQITELGERMDGWLVGDLVTVPPLIPCGTCEQCLRGVPSRCEDYDYFGSRRDGAYTEFALVPKTNLLRVPAGNQPGNGSPDRSGRHRFARLDEDRSERRPNLCRSGLRRNWIVCHSVGQNNGGLSHCGGRHRKGSH